MSRLPRREGVGFTAGAVLDPDVGLADRWLTGARWTGFLVAAAVLVGVLVQMPERRLDVAAVSPARRPSTRRWARSGDLRARFLAAQQARLGGVRVVPHEFHRPVASLTPPISPPAACRRRRG